MPEEERLRSEAAEWLKDARGDLDSAQALLPLAHIQRYVVCFHAQQAAEKSLKAVLTFKSVHAARVHDLEFLLQDCAAAGIAPPGALADLPELSPFAAAERYPDGRSEVHTDEQTRRALDLAGLCLEWARSVLGFGA